MVVHLDANPNPTNLTILVKYGILVEIRILQTPNSSISVRSSRSETNTCGTLNCTCNGYQA